MSKRNVFEFEASMPIEDVIGMQEMSLHNIKEQFGNDSQVVELFDNTIKYLKLLQDIMNNNDIIEHYKLN